MMHVVVLKNGIPLGTVNSRGANVTPHNHGYLTVTGESFAQSFVAKPVGESTSGGALYNFGVQMASLVNLKAIFSQSQERHRKREQSMTFLL
ncbi:MAG: hypothetical protein QM793_00365 [Muricomes sp.]